MFFILAEIAKHVLKDIEVIPADAIIILMRQRFDYILLGTVATLLVLGIIILAGVSAPLAVEHLDDPVAYLKHQLLFGLFPGIIAGIVGFKISISLLKKLALLFLSANILLMILVFLPWTGSTVNDRVSRWVTLGPITFQPSEFLKLTFILYLAAWCTSRIKFSSRNLTSSSVRKAPSTIDRLWNEGLIPFIIILILISIILVLQPDIGTLGIIAASGFFVYFIAKTPLWHSAILFVLSAIALVILVLIAPYRMERILVFFNPSVDPQGIGYQLKQALISIGSGGIFGAGFPIHYQQLQLLPSVVSDTIFAAMAQQTGFLGATALVLLFSIFLWQGIAIAKKTNDFFMGFLAAGITFWITLQAFINMGTMLGLVPLTGIPLPFISYGGSHLIAELAGVGILLNISRQAR